MDSCPGERGEGQYEHRFFLPRQVLMAAGEARRSRGCLGGEWMSLLKGLRASKLFSTSHRRYGCMGRNM